MYEVLAMVKQLGIPTFFLTLSCADLRWDELPHIINKLNKLGLSDDEIKNLSYEERCKYLNTNPVLVARHFQYRVQVFFKEILLDGPLGKTEFYVYRVEFQVRGSPHIHSFLWIKNAPTLTSETEQQYINFVESTVSAKLPDPSEQPDLYNFVKTYQIHTHSRTCWKYNKNKCRFHYGRYFTDRTIIAKPLPSDLNDDEKNEILVWRENILSKAKNYIDNHLFPAKRNIVDPSQDNFEQPPTIPEILSELEIEEDDYYRALSISKDNDYELHLIRPPNSCFVNNYFDVGLCAWQANMDIQPVFNQYKAVLYVCSYFAKAEDQCSEAMKQAAKEAIENELDEYQAMKTILRAYINKRECSVQEAVYHILPELHLRKIFPGVFFANSNLPEERTKILLTEDELSMLPDNSTEIFRRNNLDRYIDRPDQQFCSGKYSIIDSFCFAEFLAYYSLISKPKDNNIAEEYQPDILPDELIEENHGLCGYPKTIKLMNSKEKMRCRKVRRVLRYHVPNKHRSSRKICSPSLVSVLSIQVRE